MWKKINGKLIQTTDTTRVKFRTNISKSMLEQLQSMALENGTHVNYLLENGLQNVLAEDVIQYNKKLRPKDRVQYKTTYDRELLTSVKEFANEQQLFINDVIEYSVSYIDLEKVKKSNYKNRIE